jgi:diguanylate cyclase (GGDEF)-like protein
MAKIDHDFLEAVIRITGERDQESLEASLVAAIREFAPAREIALYKIYDQEVLLAISSGQNGLDAWPDGLEPAVPLYEHDEFMDCVNKREAVVLEVDGGAKIISPVLVDDRVVGFLTVICDQASSCDQRLISGLMRIYQNQLSIINESECDRLTGLLNRKTFDDKIVRILLANRDSSDRKMPVEHRRMLPQAKGTNWLAILDIDHFKRINDTFGHLYGDEVLLLLSRLMKRTFRGADLLFRFGGEEFIVVLPSLEVRDVWVTLERFRKAVETFPFPQVGKVTVSIGFVDMGSQYVPATVVGHADQALYYAKRNGRNRICSYEDLIAAGKLSGGMASGDAELF